MEEVWKDIIGYEGYYQASNLGRIRSLDRYITYVNGRVDLVRGQIKALRVRKDGYLTLNLCKDCKKKTHSVSVLVYEAFKGKRTKGMHVCHNDSNPLNNKLDNLREDTPAGNFFDKIANGTTARGERQGAHKLSVSQVMSIRSDPRPQRIIAAEYGVSQGHISRIKRRAEWRHF